MRRGLACVVVASFVCTFSTGAFADFQYASSADTNAAAGNGGTFVVSDGGTLAHALTLDAVSNPEPGTIALFALGAAGLGAFAWRRRRRRAARATG
jgi:hypothetical protein